MTNSATRKLKHVVHQVSANMPYESAHRRYVGLEHIRSWTGEILPENVEEPPEGTVALFEPGDILFGKLRPYLAKVALTTFSGACSTEALVLRPRSGFDAGYLRYVLSNKTFIDDVDASTYGTKMPRASWEFIGSRPIPVTPLDRQKTIADFLDRETGCIDQLIEKKEKFVRILKEKREAVMAHAVTQGINPKVSKRESGEAWLGMTPAHWQIVPPTALFRESKERAREGDQMLSSTQKYGVIPLAQFEELEQRQVTMAFVHLDKRKHVEVGDFVISMRSMDGGLERARAVGSVRSSYSVLKAGPDVDGRFYGALLKSSLYIQALRQTANFIRDGQDMNFSHFRKVRLPKLPVAEQSEIADYIEVETHRIAALIELTERSIERLREYRAALITAAVTGQIDLANWKRASTKSRRGSPV